MSVIYALFKGLSTVSLAFLIVGCGIYRSAGRDQFESRYQGQVTLGGLSQDGCWLQSATEPLLIADLNHQQYKVRPVSAEEIEVCLD